MKCVLTGAVQIALEAIYSSPGGPGEEDAFRKAEDGKGFTLRVVPHPGDAEANFVWADLIIRCLLPGHAWRCRQLQSPDLQNDTGCDIPDTSVSHCGYSCE